VIGAVSRLWRYPVKSMLGEECEHVDVDTRGVAGDRAFAVRDAAGKLGSGKTTRRFRQIDGLFAYRAVYSGEAPEILFPDGRRFRSDDPQVHRALSDMLQLPVALAREDRVSHLDSGPVHIVTTASLAWLRAALPDARVDERRFRPNLLVETAGDGLVEHGWLGKTLCIGKSVRLHVNRLTERCRMVTLAQGDLPADPRVLTRIGREADLHFGVYAEVVVPGRIAREDPITEAP
jgi:uncharacterized protein